MESPTTLDEVRHRPVLDIPTAGRLAFGLSRSASYRAAESGHLPTIAIGERRRVVPTVQLLALLEGRSELHAPEEVRDHAAE